MLIDIGHMPGPDAVGDWLRRMGEQEEQEALRLVGKVTKSARQLTFKVRASVEQLRKPRIVRRLIYQLA